jgi:hypothetical protein
MKTIKLNLREYDVDSFILSYILKGKLQEVLLCLGENSYLTKYIETNNNYYKQEIFKYIYLRHNNKNIFIDDSKFEDKIKKIRKENKSQIKYKTYIMKDELNSLYKIGKSKNPRLREKTLQSEKPSIKIVKVFEENIEKELHNKYKEFRVRGEWFDLNKIQINYICTKY